MLSKSNKINFIVLSLIIFLVSIVVNAKPPISYKNNSLTKILLVVALEAEPMPLIKAFHLHENKKRFSMLPMRSYIGKDGNLEIFLILNGKDLIYKTQHVGTQAAVLSTYLGIERYHPDLIINIGTAGGNQKLGARVGDIYISKIIYFYDRRMQGSHYKYGSGNYASVDLHSFFFHCANNVKYGVVCSGDSYDVNQTDAHIIDKFHCDAIDMEAAGVAWVSVLTRTPMIAIKGITDYYGSLSNHQDHRKNTKFVSEQLALKLKELLCCVK